MLFWRTEKLYFYISCQYPRKLYLQYLTTKEIVPQFCKSCASKGLNHGDREICDSSTVRILDCLVINIFKKMKWPNFSIKILNFCSISPNIYGSNFTSLKIDRFSLKPNEPMPTVSLCDALVCKNECKHVTVTMLSTYGKGPCQRLDPIIESI